MEGARFESLPYHMLFQFGYLGFLSLIKTPNGPSVRPQEPLITSVLIQYSYAFNVSLRVWTAPLNKLQNKL